MPAVKGQTSGNYVRSWTLAARPLTLTASATPVLIGTALAATQGPIDWLLFSLALVGAVLIQVGTNLADEYIDHRRTGGAAKFPAPHKVIQRGLLAPRAVLAGAVLSFAVSAAMGLYIVSQVGWPILLVGILSILAGYLHSSGPFPLGHWALGELTVFLFMGVVIVMASYFVQAQEITWPGFWSSLPIAFLVTAILQCNNLRDVDEDRSEGKHTLVTLLGARAGRWVYAVLVLGAYLVLVAAVLAGVTPKLAILGLAPLPWALSLVQRLWQATARPHFNAVLMGSARLHLATGLLIALGISLHSLLAR